MEFPVCFLERLRNPGDIVHKFQPADQVHIDPGRIAHQSDDCLEFTLGNMCTDTLILKPLEQMRLFFCPDAFFQRNNHAGLLLSDL